MKNKIKDLENILGHDFKNHDLIKQALIQKEYELYKSEVQLKTHTNPIQL